MLIVVSVNALVAIVKKQVALSATVYKFLQILSLTLFEKTPVNWQFNAGSRQKIPDAGTNQLILLI